MNNSASNGELQKERIMNNKNVNPVYVTVGVGAVSIITTKIITKAMAKRKTRKKVDAMSPEVRAIFVATGRVVRKINNGEYVGKSEDDIVTDFQFEKIIAQNEEW